MADRFEASERALLITGARVYTADPQQPWAEALLLRNNHIQFVGAEAEARAVAGGRAEEARVDGGLVVPGLNDSHLHMTQASHYLRLLNLEGVESVAELQARVRAYADSHPEHEWLEGYGLSYEPFAGLDYPERVALDAAVANRPVVIRGFDGHSSWANSEALRRVGLDRGALLPHPKIVIVDPATGLATGRMKEKGPQNCVIQIPYTLTEAERDDMLCTAMVYLNQLGITSVQNMDGDAERLVQYERLRARGASTVRANHYLSIRQETPSGRLREYAELVRQHTDPWNHACGIKICIDGVIETKTALMLTPYADGSDETGVPDIDLDLFRQIVHEADGYGMAIATHAIGDRSVRVTLDAYEAAQRSNPDGRRLRHRVEHIELCHPDDVKRFASLGVVASMQPLHATPGGDPRYATWATMVGPDRAAHCFPWQTVLRAGAVLSFGSDWPVVTPDVRSGLHTAMTRTNREGIPLGGWNAHERIGLSQALDAYTRDAAFAEGQEEVKGVLQPGMLADVTVFARDLFLVPPAELPSVEIALTIVDGRIVHRSGL